ncbi:MAG: hypothetical protein ABSC06_11725 [Rhodopila sp.]
MQIVAIVHDPGYIGSKTDRRTLQLAGGKADGPGIELFYRLQLDRTARSGRKLRLARTAAGLSIRRSVCRHQSAQQHRDNSENND